MSEGWDDEAHPGDLGPQPWVCQRCDRRLAHLDVQQLQLLRLGATRVYPARYLRVCVDCAEGMWGQLLGLFEVRYPTPVPATAPHLTSETRNHPATTRPDPSARADADC